MRDKHGRKYRGILARIMLGMMISLLGLMLFPQEAKASQNDTPDMDYTDIQDVINDIMDSGNAFNFGDYVGKLINGEEAFSIAGIGNQLISSVKGEVKANIATLGRLISIALIAAIFTNISMAFKNNHVAETGYYVTYLLMFGLLISTFINASMIAASVIGSILEFMKALVPAYFLSVGFCTGSVTSMVYYEAALMMITLVDLIIVKIIIPMINFYLIITLANNLSKEDMLSRLAGLFSTTISWMLKSLLAAVIGFHTIQGLIVPVADKVKRSTLLKASEAIPGIGNTFGSVAETVLGAGVLLKNAIGVTGLIVILVISAVPFLKLFIITCIYKIGSASLQPVSDKRIIECIGASAKSAGMLLQAVFVAAVLFLISITIVAVTTGGA